MTVDLLGVRAGAPRERRGSRVVVVGAGPAGLTAAYRLAGEGVTCRVLEADSVVGGISRTVERDGWRFDIGGHRFFTKVPAVERLWFEILGREEFLRRPRRSRIHYRGAMFDYPLRAFNALSGLGLVEAARCMLSYAWAQVRPAGDQTHFEGWTTSRFGSRLYRIFFKTYTEKVWGMPATEIQADWAAQRIKNLSLLRAVVNACLPRRGRTDVTSLIEEFNYPRLGPGMMWERAHQLVTDAGSSVELGTRVTGVRRAGGRAVAVITDHNGEARELAADHVISSMPLGELVLALDPPAPAAVRDAALRLRHRDFLTVALVVPEDQAFPDNWIYIHDPEVEVGRIQNYGSWSPDMVRPGFTCLGMEYFVSQGDRLWEMADGELVTLATDELRRLRLVRPDAVRGGHVVRMPKAYPVYDTGYQERVAVIRDWLSDAVPNVHPVGRNGMHRYNNQDHSMLTAMLTVENILGADHDVWAVNVDEDYHEETRTLPGRSAPARPGVSAEVA